MFQRGERTPYLGGGTVNKTAQSPYETVDPSLLDQSAQEIGRLAKGPLKELMDTMMREKTLTDPDVVAASSSQYRASSFEQRGSILSLPSGCMVNSNPMVLTHMSIFSESEMKFYRGSSNHTIMFQGIKVMIASILCHKAMSRETMEGTWAGLLLCDGCNREVYDGDFTLSRPSVYPALSLGLENEMLFHPVEEVGGQRDKDESFYEYWRTRSCPLLPSSQRK